MFWTCRHHQLHRKAINVVLNLLASHDVDPRYQHGDVKARIATLYVPLIGIVIDALPQLCVESRPMTQQHSSTEIDGAHSIDQNIAMAIAGSTLYSIPGESSTTVIFLIFRTSLCSTLADCLTQFVCVLSCNCLLSLLICFLCLSWIALCLLHSALKLFGIMSLQPYYCYLVMTCSNWYVTVNLMYSDFNVISL